MTEKNQISFEERWQQAQSETGMKHTAIAKKITVDLSIENVLDRYTSFISKAATENRISESVFQDLHKQTKRYKKALGTIDDGSLLGELKELTDIFHSFD